VDCVSGPDRAIRKRSAALLRSIAFRRFTRFDGTSSITGHLTGKIHQRRSTLLQASSRITTAASTQVKGGKNPLLFEGLRSDWED
jgi:hypothetical protein